MSWTGSTVPPTLGVTATLALLWLVVAAQQAPLPCLGRGPLALAPAALMAGELGQLHIHAANLLAAAADANRHLILLKAMAGVVLGVAAVAPILAVRHRSCSSKLIMGLPLGGTASILLDAVPTMGVHDPWWAAAEEWSELAVCSIVVDTILATAIKSHYETIVRLSFGGLSRFQTWDAIRRSKC